MTPMNILGHVTDERNGARGHGPGLTCGPIYSLVNQRIYGAPGPPSRQPCDTYIRQLTEEYNASYSSVNRQIFDFLFYFNYCLFWLPIRMESLQNRQNTQHRAARHIQFSSQQ
jgi:hypothetical protein